MQVLVRTWKGKHYIVSVYTTSGRMVLEIGAYRMRSGGTYLQAIYDEGYGGYVVDIAELLVRYSGRDIWEVRSEIAARVLDVLGGR